MPKAKPVSLFPLSFEEALDALIKGSTGTKKPKKKRAKSKPKTRKKSL
jgi:hypothetical protein